MTGSRLMFLAALGLPLVGCAVGETVSLPAPVAASFGQAAASSLPPQQDVQWWRRLQDPTLDRLVALALADNPDLRQAAARVSQAEAQMRISGASRGPQAGLNGQAGALRLPSDVADRIEGLETDVGQAQLQLQAGWEVDVWGKASNAAKADVLGYLGAQESLQAARASLIAQIAAAYADLSVADARLACARQTQSDRSALLDLARSRRDAGVAEVSEVKGAEADLAQQQAAVAALESQRSQTRHALSLLTGRPDDEIAPLLQELRPLPVAPAPPGAGLPNDLLRNRPDVVQAEYAALAQYARLESARADLYPSFSLSGALGSSSTTLGDGSLTDLFNWDQRLLSAGLSVAMPLFNRGRLVAQVDLQDAGFNQAVAAYQKVVLDAQREVLDALVQYRGARQAAADAADGLNARRRQTALAQHRVDAGAGLRAERLNASLAEHAALDADLQARGDVLKAWISLNRALGNGARLTQSAPLTDLPST